MDKYTNIQKAAILLLSLGPDVTVEVMKHLNEKEIESITKEITNLRMVSAEVKEKVQKEFHDIVVASRVVSYGGIDVAKDLLQRTFGDEKAAGFLNRLGHSRTGEKPFEFVQQVDSTHIFNLLQYENAQTIALILSYLDADKAAAILSSFTADKQIEIAKRIAVMDMASPEIVQQVELVLKDKLSSNTSNDHDLQNGIDSIVNILSSVDRSTEKNILETLTSNEPELAYEIKQKMFVFDDIAFLDNRTIQRVLMDVQNQDVSLALRNANDGVKDAIFRNISKRRLETLEEELASTEQVRVKDIEEAQSRFVAVVRKLEREGVIIISRNGEENLG